MELFEELNEKDALELWLKLAGDCKTTQEKTLLEIVKQAKNTEYGIKHNFSNIKSIDDFQKEVPISEYDEFEDYIERMADGAKNLLFPGLTNFFISTSGTTGNSKKIPESDSGLKAKSSVLKLRNAFLIKAVIEKFKTNPRVIKFLKEKEINLNNTDSLINNCHFYSLTSASPNKKTKGGIDIGFASGKTFENYAFSKRSSYPPELMGLANGEATMYLTMLFALRYDDIVLITSNNAGRFYNRVKYAQKYAKQIIDDLRNGSISGHIEITSDERKLFESYLKPHPERADELEKLLNKGIEYFTPKYYWPNLLVARFWLKGSVGVNVAKLKKYLPDDLLYWDVGYGASEGKLTIPIKENEGYGTLATSSIFFEFIDENGNILTADNLKDDCDYEIILTTYSGLYRYQLHDIVRVKGFFENTPNIEFITKSREIINIAQEKIPAPGILDILTDFMRNNNLTSRQAQIYPNNDDLCYEIYVELEDSSNVNVLKLSKDFDNVLREKFELYGRNREFESLNEVKIILMKDGWQKSLYDTKDTGNVPRSQINLEAMILKRPDNEWILKEE